MHCKGTCKHMSKLLLLLLLEDGCVSTHMWRHTRDFNPLGGFLVIYIIREKKHNVIMWCNIGKYGVVLYYMHRNKEDYVIMQVRDWDISMGMVLSTD